MRHRALARCAAAVAALVTVAACGQSGTVRPAAVVDGVEISQQAVVDELEAIGGNPLYSEGFQVVTGRPISGQSEGTYDAAFVNETLALQIQYQIILNEVAERGIEIDENCRAEGENGYVQQLSAFSDTGDGREIFDAFPEAYRQTLVERQAAILALVGDLVGVGCFDDDVAREYFDAYPERFALACASHILVATEEEALDVREELLDGADFAELAREVSVDPAAQGDEGEEGAGGDYGCFDISRGFIDEFMDAVLTQPVGEIGEPVPTQFGYHVILVRERQPQTFEEVGEAVVRSIAEDAAGDAFSAFLTEAAAASDVDVDPRYGTWDPRARVINRPVAPAGDATTGAGQ